MVMQFRSIAYDVECGNLGDVKDDNGVVGRHVAEQNADAYKTNDLLNLSDSLNHLSLLCHSLAAAAGWWGDKTGKFQPREVGTTLMLMVSEISEGMEGERKDLMDEHLPHRKSIEVEIADLLIRAFDYAGGRGLDIGGALIEKLVYNAARADHKLENRNKEGGKAF